jgi:hypothetical protein
MLIFIQVLLADRIPLLETALEMRDVIVRLEEMTVTNPLQNADDPQNLNILLPLRPPPLDLLLLPYTPVARD